MGSLPEPLAELGLEGLPDLKPLNAPWSKFTIPILEDKPQNPIIRSLEHVYNTGKPRTDKCSVVEVIASPVYEEEELKEQPKDIWLEARQANYDYKDRIVSWDTFRSTYRNPKSPSPFITEQAPQLSIASRNPERLVPSITGNKELNVTIPELRDALRSTLVGCSSSLHHWDVVAERFVPVRGTDGDSRIIIEGMDEVISESYVSQFVESGTLLRRLDTLVIDLRRTASDNNSTVFAFAYALSSALVWVRNQITDLLLCVQSSICDLGVAFQEIRAVLAALASLFSRDSQIEATSYHHRGIPRTPQTLLSHIYDFLTLQVDLHAPRLVRAVISYILTVTSRPYFTIISDSIGLSGLADLLDNERRKAMEGQDSGLLHVADRDSDDESDKDVNEEFPSFASGDMRDAIIRARRSIHILSSHDYEATRTIQLPEFRRLEWIWTDDAVSRRALGEDLDGLESNPPAVVRKPGGCLPEGEMNKYKPELARLAIFDVEPGSLSDNVDLESFVKFISIYPDYPPALAPTLSLLSELVLSPVSAQASALGRAALQRFLTPDTSLHFRAHLVLMRSYLLIAAPSFKARLAAALFSDTDIDEDAETAEENPMALTMRKRARNANWQAVRAKKDAGNVQSRKERPWAVGLAFGLTERAQWPPVDSELAFYLRRVITDSLEDVKESKTAYADRDDLGDDHFWEEAESRLGFAVRSLPVGNGGEKWMDPTQLEALDFLYADYRPPDALHCLITPDIRSKYQRIFAFLLHLLRVENAMRLVYRVTRPYSSGRVFPEFPDTQSLILHFRFVAQAFVSALSAYVADTAIRGNIDAFISRVRYAESIILTDSDTHGMPFADVYGLMQRHSRVLDSVLAACLLRTAQRAVGDIMRALLEVILEFAVLVGNAYRSTGVDPRDGVFVFDEGKAAVRVEALFAKFCKTKDALVKALRKVTERGSKAFAMDNSYHPQDGLPSAPGGMEALSNLLLRLGKLKVEKQ